MLLRTETLWLGLQMPVLVVAGLGALLMGLLLGLGGTRHRTAVAGMWGAALGALGGLLTGGWLPLPSWIGILIGAVVGAGLFLLLRNVVAAVLAVLIFSAAGGAAYLAVVLDRVLPPMGPQAVVVAPEGHSFFSDMNRPERLIYLNQISRQDPTFVAQARALGIDTWQVLGPHGGRILWAVAGGAVLGILLIWLTFSGALALAWAFMGTAAMMVGVQAVLVAAGAGVISHLATRPWLPALALLAATVVGWVWQLLWGRERRPGQESREEAGIGVLDGVRGDTIGPAEPGSVEQTDGSADAGLGRELGRSDGALSQFLSTLLTTECSLGPAEAGAVLRRTEQASVDVLAVRPVATDKTAPPPWLRRAAELMGETLAANRPTATAWPPPDPYYPSNGQHILVLPVSLAQTGSVATAFLINATDQRTLEAIRERLRLSLSLLGLSESRQGSQQVEAVLRCVRKAVDILAAVNRQRRFDGTTLALCREVATQWHCDRASLGVRRGHGVLVTAMSDAASLSRTVQARRDVEAAMDECLDQDCDILHPVVNGSICISRQAAELARRHGRGTVASLPVRYSGKVWGVLTLERAAPRPFAPGEIEGVRLALESCAARLAALREHDRWLGTRLAGRLGKILAAVVGPRYVWAKVTLLLLVAVASFLVLAQGNYRAEASFILEGTQSQVVPAPFDGYLQTVKVEVSDAVRAQETFLAELDTAELRLKLAEAKAEKTGYLKQADVALRDGETAQAQIAQANAEKAQAQIALLEHLIGQARILSPLSGIIVQGDLKRQIGAPVKMGDVLFEVTPLESLRAVVHVPEDQIGDVRVGQRGTLATASYPGQRIAFEVERINPIAEVVKQQNIFKVRVRLGELCPWMRPGMEGVARIDLGRRSYAWIWSRRVVNWIRMKLWL